MSEKVWSEADWQVSEAQRECATRGHSWTVKHAGGVPVRLVCDRPCGAPGYVVGQPSTQVAEAREEIRQRILATPTTPNRDTYDDGYGQGLAEAINILDRLTPPILLAGGDWI